MRKSASQLALKRILKLIPVLTNENLNDLIKAMGTEVAIRRTLNQVKVKPDEIQSYQAGEVSQTGPASEASAEQIGT